LPVLQVQHTVSSAADSKVKLTPSILLSTPFFLKEFIQGQFTHPQKCGIGNGPNGSTHFMSLPTPVHEMMKDFGRSIHPKGSTAPRIQ
jgi:hypothetical protein